MTVWIEDAESITTTALLANSLIACRDGNQVQFLTTAGRGAAVVQRLRTALSRSRKRNQTRGQRVAEFTLHHSIYPYTKNGRRYDCVVLWTHKRRHHIAREILDDTLKG